MWLYDQIVETYKGGPGSGNWGHAGVKGSRGGSAPKRGMGAGMSLATGPTSKKRQEAAREAGKKAKEKEAQKPIEEQNVAVLDAKKVSDDYFVATPTVKDGRKAINWEKVKGKPVTIKGQKDQDFFIHRPSGSTQGWVISEGRTGTMIGGGQLTQKATKIAVTELLAKATKTQTFKQVMQKYLEGAATRDGLVLRSPRYGGQSGVVAGRSAAKPLY